MTSLGLKIGLDYHGVINKRPAYFAEFCRQAKERGHHIYIITGGPVPKVRQYLSADGIDYDFIFAISDYYQALGKAELMPNGRIDIPDYLWNIAKADFCRRSHVNFHIDDSIDYLHWFSTPFCLYDSDDNICYLSPGIELNFSQPPDIVLDNLEQIVDRLACVY